MACFGSSIGTTLVSPVWYFLLDSGPWFPIGYIIAPASNLALVIVAPIVIPIWYFLFACGWLLGFQMAPLLLAVDAWLKPSVPHCCASRLARARSSSIGFPIGSPVGFPSPSTGPSKVTCKARLKENTHNNNNIYEYTYCQSQCDQHTNEESKNRPKRWAPTWEGNDGHCQSRST